MFNQTNTTGADMQQTSVTMYSTIAELTGAKRMPFSNIHLSNINSNKPLCFSNFFGPSLRIQTPTVILG